MCRLRIASTLLALLFATVSLAGDVTNHIPADALGYVVVQRLADTDDAIQALSERAKLPVPSLISLVGSKTGIEEGIDFDGSVAIAFLRTAQGPSAAVFLPVTDYRNFLVQLEADDAKNGIASASLGGTTVIVGQRDDYAVICWPTNRELLTTLLTQTTAATTWGELDSRHNVVAAVSTTGLSLLVDLGSKGLAEAKKVMRADLGEDNPALAGIQVYDHLLRAIKSEITSFRIGLEIEEQGSLRIHEEVRVAQDGKFLPLMQKLPDQEGSLLGNLPNIPYVMLCSGRIPAGATQPLLDFSADMMKSMQQLYGLSPEQVDRLMEISERQLPEIQGMAFMMGVGQVDAPLYNQMLAALRVRDAASYMASYQTYWNEFSAVIQEAESPLFKETTLVETSINGRQAFKLSMSLQAFEGFQVPEIDFDSLMEKLYGPGGLTVYLAAADEHTILIGYTDADLLESALQSADVSTNISHDSDVNHTTGLLPGKGHMVGFWDASGTVAFINRAIQLVVKDKPLLPDFPNAPPVGWTMNTQGDSLHIQTVVPAELFNALGQYVVMLQTRGAEANVPSN